MPKTINIELDKADIAKLEKALQAKSNIRFQAVVKKNVVQMLNAARQAMKWDIPLNMPHTWSMATGQGLAGSCRGSIT